MMPRARFDLPLPADPDLNFEQAQWQAGLARIAGLDEAGRGALAGPVVAAVVVLPADSSLLEQLHGVRDSKQMSARQREHWSEIIRIRALAWGVGAASRYEVDWYNILRATRIAMLRALEALPFCPDALLLDAIRLPGFPCPQTDLIKGDARSLSIAAASVLAKTARDALMVELDEIYPGYGFAIHKGYGTLAHRAALAELGPSPAHRRSYAPVRELLK